MSEHDQTRKFADKSAAIASETLEKGKAAAEQATRVVQQSYSVTVEPLGILLPVNRPANPGIMHPCARRSFRSQM
jgi:hypothetical protein